MANEWMRQDDATPQEALDTWHAMEAEFKANRAMLQEPRFMAQGGRIGYEDGQLVRNTADGSRPGYGGPGSGSRVEHRIKKPHQYEYFKDKDFVKWAKKNAHELFYTKSTVALYKQGIYMPDIFRKYETHLAKKNKIFGVVGLVEALGTDNPYSSTSIQTAFSQKNKKIQIKNIMM